VEREPEHHRHGNWCRYLTRARTTAAAGAGGNDRALTSGAATPWEGQDPMTDQQNTAIGFAGLIQLWTIQLRSITEGLAGMAGLSESVLSQSVRSLQGLPPPAPYPQRS